MPAIIIRSSRTQQPTAPLRVDWSNPLTRELATAGYALNGVMYDAVGNSLGAVTSTSSNSDGFSTNGTTAFQRLTKSVTTTGGYTLAALTTANVRAGTRERLLCLTASGGVVYTNSTVGYYQIFETGGAYSIESAHTITTLGNNAFASASITSAEATGEHFYATSNNYAVNGVSIYVDGRDKSAGATTASDGTIWTTTSNGLDAGKLTFQDGTYFGRWNRFRLALHWTRVLSATEHRELGRNPWQLFRPIERRIWAPSTAAATFNPAWARGSTSIVGSGLPGG